MRESQDERAWLEPLLRQGLHHVPAPAKLWDRVSLPRTEAERTPAGYRFVWALAGASVLTASILAVAWGSHSTQGLKLQSHQTAEVRTWIRDRTGIDVPLASPSSESIAMKGASIADNGAIEVRYRAADREARLVISRATPSARKHSHAALQLLSHTRRVSWSSNGQAYTLAVEGEGGDMRAACLVCHAESAI